MKRFAAAVFVFGVSVSSPARAQVDVPDACYQDADGTTYNCGPDAGTVGGLGTTPSGGTPVTDAGSNCRLVQVVQNNGGGWTVTISGWPPIPTFTYNGTMTVQNTYVCGP